MSDSKANDKAMYSKLVDKLLELEAVAFAPSSSGKDRAGALKNACDENALFNAWFKSLDGKGKDAVRADLETANLPLFSYSNIGKVKGLCFSYAFAPVIDSASILASQRLPYLSKLFGNSVSWTVVSQIKAKSDIVDESFRSFNSQFKYSEKIEIKNRCSKSFSNSFLWANRANEAVAKIDAKVCYSVSGALTSHVAASNYKAQKPGVLWIAEIESPGTLDLGECLLEEWRLAYDDVFKNADIILFPTEELKDYFVAQSRDQSLAERIEQRHVVVDRPALDRRYSSFSETEFKLRSKKSAVNIMYFEYQSSFTRNYAPLDALLDNKNVYVHVPNVPGDFKQFMLNELSTDKRARLTVYNSCGIADIMKLCEQCDYALYLDYEPMLDRNPYVPSELVDLREVGTSWIVYSSLPHASLEGGQAIRVSNEEELRDVFNR